MISFTSSSLYPTEDAHLCASSRDASNSSAVGSFNVFSIITSPEAYATNLSPASIDNNFRIATGKEICPLDETVKKIPLAAPEQKIFLITRTPKEMAYLIDNGLEIKEVNIGNMHSSPDKKRITGNMYVSEEDVSNIKDIISKGIRVFSQTTPSAPLEEIKM